MQQWNPRDTVFLLRLTRTVFVWHLWRPHLQQYTVFIKQKHAGKHWLSPTLLPVTDLRHFETGSGRKMLEVLLFRECIHVSCFCVTLKGDGCYCKKSLAHSKKCLPIAKLSLAEALFQFFEITWLSEAIHGWAWIKMSPLPVDWQTSMYWVTSLPMYSACNKLLWSSLSCRKGVGG